MAKINLQLTQKNDRSCEGCTKCCDGWLTSSIFGEEMYPGKPCQFVESGVGCTIYETRPEDPCKVFSCMWKADDVVPEKFKPSEIGSIIHQLRIGGKIYLNITEAGKKIDPGLLEWFIDYCKSTGRDGAWSVDGKRGWVGGLLFSKMMEAKYKNEM
jgi:hypothetical protein